MFLTQHNRQTQQSDDLLKYSQLHRDDILSTLQSTDDGITDREANERLHSNGWNIVSSEQLPPWYVQLLTSFHNPFIYVLIVLGLFSYLTDDFEATIIVTIMIVLSAAIQFWQEFRSKRAAEQLKEMIKQTTTVVRNAQVTEIVTGELVPGDIISLQAGDIIPADIRILSSTNLLVNQSTLTGEAIPVEKNATLTERPEQIFDAKNLCFKGTDIVSGNATAIVLKTGDETFFGSLAKSIVGKRAETSFDKGVNKVSWLLIKLMLIMVPFVFLINGITKDDWQGALFFAIAIAIGLTPEMLPMIVSANLARGALRLSKKDVIVKQLHAMQNLGAMNILCTDKTGTLTEDELVLSIHQNPFGEPSHRPLYLAYVNSLFQTGTRSLLDQSIIEYQQSTAPVEHDSIPYEKIDELPFDSARKRLSVAVATTDERDQQFIITKGAVEEMMMLANAVEHEGEIIPLSQELRKQITNYLTRLNNEGLRVIAVAYQEIASTQHVITEKDEENLILAGFIGFLDPPKPSAATAIHQLQKHGVDVKILTGDNEVVTENVCKQIGIQAGQPILGPEIDHLTDEELIVAAESTNLFAKLTPLHKERIVQVLQQKEHTVGFLGDGINDAPALRKADVGISVDQATDIARESSDIILLKKSLTILEEGVVEGRTTFGNILKYIKMTTSSNFGNVFSILVASMFIPFLPMLPLQLLVQNLLYDLSQLAIPWDRMDKEFLVKPRKWDTKSLTTFIIYIGPISSIFDIVTFVVMWHVFGANTVENQALFHTGWFVVGLLTQTLIVHMIRTEKIPFIQSMATKPVVILTIIIMGIGVYLPYSTVGKSMGFVPLPGSYFLWLIAILIGYAGLIQISKRFYIKKFGSWI